MAKKRKDQLGFIGLASALLRNVAQQRSLKKSRDAKNAPPTSPKKKKPKDTRTASQIHNELDATRLNLVTTVERIKYDIDVPSRARDLRDRVAADIPSELKGRTPALVVSASILVTGLGSIIAAVARRFRR